MADNQKPALPATLDILGMKEVVPKAYEDLIQPAAKELGKGLIVIAKAVNVALSPIEGAVWGFERIKSMLSQRLIEKLAGVDDKDIQSPPLNIAGPAIMNLQFTGDIAELREMYASLLASAMNKSMPRVAHPAFVQIIEQLSVDEARIISRLAKFKCSVICSETTDSTGGATTKVGFVSDQWERLCREAGVDCIDNYQAYLDNLIRLRVLTESRSSKAELIEMGHSEYGEWDTHVAQTDSECVYITAFGEKFMLACVGDVS